MLAHLTAVAIAAFSLWTVVFVGLPVAFQLHDKLHDKRQRRASGRWQSQSPAWGHGPDWHKRRSAA